MAFYKKHQKQDKKWYPEAVIVGKPVTTDHVADRLAHISTVSRADTYAVLKELGGVLGDYMAEGRSVRLEGLGTFRYTADATGNGMDTEEEVSAKQINGVRVRFVPEIGKDWTGKIVSRSLISDEIIWVEHGGKAVPADSDEENEEDEGGSGGGGESGGGESGEGGGGGSIDPNA